jgi:protein ImuB
MACGCHSHNFAPIERSSILKETFAYDTAVDSIESILFTLSAMLKRLITRAETELTSIAWLTLSIHLDNRETNSRVVRPGSPTVSHRLLIKLIQLDLEAHPPGYSAIGLTVTAETGRSSTIQLGLFSPQLPEQSQLEITMARIHSLIGLDNAGTPIFENSHRQLTSAVDRFALFPAAQRIGPKQCHRLSMRRLRTNISMKIAGTGLPGSFIYSSTLYNVRQVYGPWATGGRWWDHDTWNHQEWDVIATSANRTDLTYCCLSSNMDATHWLLEGIYD